MSSVKVITVAAPINIALIKYWGKRDPPELILPCNDSISVTIDELHALTTIQASSTFQSDCVSVNDTALDLLRYQRFNVVFTAFREYLSRAPEHANLSAVYCHVTSTTVNFPASAGLASSAAGFAAIAYGLGQLFNLPAHFVCYLARIGSGSASRSVLGGFVHWKATIDAALPISSGDAPPVGLSKEYPYGNTECVSEVLPSFWKRLKAIVCVVSTAVKPTSSTDGMQNTVATSTLFKQRLLDIPDRIRDLKLAIRANSFENFAEIVMRDSNSLHAVCLDTWPPLVYMKDVSHELIKLVLEFNKAVGAVRVAYTFDAGPNCCLFMMDETIDDFLPCLLRYFPNYTSVNEKYVIGDTAGLNRAIDLPLEPTHNVVQKLVISNCGGGPYVAP